MPANGRLQLDASEQLAKHVRVFLHDHLLIIRMMNRMALRCFWQIFFQIHDLQSHESIGHNKVRGSKSY